MQNISAELDRAREGLRGEKYHQQWDFHVLAECLEKHASMFQRTSRDQHRDLIAQFHDCAGKLGRRLCAIPGRTSFRWRSRAPRVVPDDFGTDRPAAIGNHDVRMKANYDKTTATTEVVSSHPGEIRHWNTKWRRTTSRARKKQVAD